MPCFYLFGLISPYIAVYSQQPVFIFVVSCIRQTVSVLILLPHIIRKIYEAHAHVRSYNVNRYSPSLNR